MNPFSKMQPHTIGALTAWGATFWAWFETHSAGIAAVFAISASLYSMIASHAAKKRAERDKA